MKNKYFKERQTVDSSVPTYKNFHFKTKKKCKNLHCEGICVVEVENGVSTFYCSECSEIFQNPENLDLNKLTFEGVEIGSPIAFSRFVMDGKVYEGTPAGKKWPVQNRKIT